MLLVVGVEDKGTIVLTTRNVDDLPTGAIRMHMTVDNNEVWITSEAETAFAALRLKYSPNPDWKDDLTYNLKKKWR